MSDIEKANGGICEICGSEAEFGPDWAVCSRKCPRCGTFEYYSTVGWLEVETPNHMVRLSGWVRDQNNAGIAFPNITPELSQRVARIPLPRLRDRANRALLTLARQFPGLNDWYDPRDFTSFPELLGRTYSLDDNAAYILVRLLAESGYLRESEGALGLSVSGLLAAEDLSVQHNGSAHAFVAMSFDKTMNDAWTDGFEPAVKAAGYVPVRIDAKDYVGGVSDEIAAEIRRANFVIADYTGQRGGVYFEAGFALGLGLTVIPTCRADEIGKLHFDIRHLNTLPWEQPSDLVTILCRRIIAVLGEGPNLSA